MVWLWSMVAAWAVTPSVDPAAYTDAAEQCAQGDSDVCTALSDVALEAWLPTVWAASVGEEPHDRTWRAALRAFGYGAACVRQPAESRCRIPVGQQSYPLIEWTPELSPICWADDAHCVTPTPASPVDHIGHGAPQALGRGWATMTHGRVFPRDDREAALVHGAGAGWGDDRSWVFVPTFHHAGALSSTVAVLDAERWRDVELDLGGEGICAASPGHIRVSHEGQCTSRTRTRRLDATGTLGHDHPGTLLDHAGDYAVTHEHAEGLLRLFRGDELVWSREIHSVSIASVSDTGRVAFKHFDTWTIVDEEREVSFAFGGLASDWSGDTVYLLHDHIVVAVGLDGTPRDAWALPWSSWTFRVHPDGHSFWAWNGDRDKTDPHALVGQVFSTGEDVPSVTLPPWLADAPSHRLPWPDPDPEGRTARVLRDGAPVQGAFVQGQYTDAEGTFVQQGRVRELRIDGIEPFYRQDHDGNIEVVPVVMTRLPSGRTSTLAPVPGSAKLVKAVDLGDGAIGVVRPKESGRALVEELDAMVTVDGAEVTWTTWPRTTFKVVDESGRPLAGLLVEHPRDVPGGDRGMVGLDGTVTLRDIDAPLRIGGRDVQRDGDTLVFARSAPTQPLGPVLEITDLTGRWHARGPDGLDAVEHVFVPNHETRQDGRIVEHDGDWFVPLDPHRMVEIDGAYAPYEAHVSHRAWERPTAVPRRRTTPRRFVGHFGWRVGDRMTRQVDGNVLDEGTVDAFEDMLRIRWSLQATGQPFPGARTTYLTQDGRYVGTNSDDFDAFQSQIDQVLQASDATVDQRRLAYQMFRPLGDATWKEMAARAWYAELGALVGRELVRDQPLVLTMRAIHSDEAPQRVELEYLGTQPCSFGRCAHVAITRGDGDDARRSEWWLDPATLRPAQRRLMGGEKAIEEQWTWTR